jgi:hypothetical protein
MWPSENTHSRTFVNKVKKSKDRVVRSPLSSRATDLLLVSPRSVLRAAAADGCTPTQLIEPRR